MPRDALRALQEKAVSGDGQAGWEIPFFQRHGRAAGLEPGHVRSLDDLQKIPPYSVHKIRESIEGKRMPLVLQTSGGTTCLPHPMLYAPARPAPTR